MASPLPSGHTIIDKTTDPTLDWQTMAQQWGFAYSYLTHTPELANLFQQAVKGSWTPDRFQAAVRNSKYYAKFTQQARQNQLLRYTDPAEYARRLQQVTEKVQDTLGAYGGTLTKAQTALVAQHAFDGGWDDTELAHNIAGTVNWRATLGDDTKTVNGQAASIGADVRAQAANYGVNVSDNFVADRVQNILEGRETKDFYQNYFTRVAKQTYPGYAEQIDGGANVKTIADAYVQNMASTLELNPEQIKLTDPTIKKAMQNIDTATGKPSLKPMWQFEQDLRSDPRWQKTSDARNTYASVATAIGRMFGKL